MMASATSPMLMACTSRDPPALDNAVIEARRDHQRDRNRHQDQRQGLDMLRMPWQFIEAFAERRAQLEAEQDLRPEDQHPGFVERGLDLFRQLHFGSSVALHS